MSEGESRQFGFHWNWSMFITAAALLLCLALPWVFRGVSPDIPDTQVIDGISPLKPPSDLLKPAIWWPLSLFSALFLAGALGMALRTSPARAPAGSGESSGMITKQMAFLGSSMLAVYAIHFLLPFPLHRYYDLTRVSMGWIADRSWIAAISTSFAIVALFLLYSCAYRLSLRQDSRRLWSIILIGALFFALINFFVFSLNSTDLYDYISRGRISGAYGANPLVQVPDDFPDDPFVQLAAWRKDPSAYGPLWEILSGLIGRLLGGRLWASFLAYKGLAFTGYLVSTAVIALTLRRLSPDHALSGTLLFAWNPLVLLEGVANAHNDMLMMAFLLAGFWVLSHAPRLDAGDGYFEPSSTNLMFAVPTILFLGLAILVKFIPLLVLPPVLIVLVAKEEGGWRKLRPVFFLLLPLSALLFLYYGVFWEWPEIAQVVVQRTTMFRMSLASLTKQLLGLFLREGLAQALASWSFLGIFGLSYCFVIIRTVNALWKPSCWQARFRQPSKHKSINALMKILLGEEPSDQRKPWEILVTASLRILLLYLLLGSLWFWPWYLIWPIALLALSGDERMVVLLMVVGGASQLTHILWNFVWYWMGITWETLYTVERLATCLMVLPALAIYLACRRRGQTVRLQT
jgi:hypothetical protein